MSCDVMSHDKVHGIMTVDPAIFHFKICPISVQQIPLNGQNNYFLLVSARF